MDLFGKNVKVAVIGSIVFVSVLLAAVSPVAADEQGVTAGSVTIGMANALSGPASALGRGMKEGALEYF